MSGTSFFLRNKNQNHYNTFLASFGFDFNDKLKLPKNALYVHYTYNVRSLCAKYTHTMRIVYV